MVKPSTGYAVQFMFEHAVSICRENTFSSQGYIRKKRFLFYDALLIKILQNKPKLGKAIFQQLFARNTTKNILHFLSEKTTKKNEAKIFSTLPYIPFLTEASRFLFAKQPLLKKIALLLFAFLSYCLFPIHVQYILGLVLGIGFVLIGLPHGALDHKVMDKKIWSPDFLSIYIGIMGLVALGWIVSPAISLFVFLLFSAWHFGETEFRDLGIENTIWA